MKNIYEDPLDSFTFEEMFAQLGAINAETYRLDFKREIPPKKLAHRVCSFANAEGGIIAIGFEDPNPTKELELSTSPPVIDDRELLRIRAVVNAWIYPIPQFALHGYLAGDGRRILVMRIQTSDRGPHEYIGSDESNLPVRRGTLTQKLSLTEIEALQGRRSGSVPISPLGANRYPRVSLQLGGSGDFFIGVVISPTTYAARRILDASDDLLISRAEAHSRGTGNIVHAALIGQKTINDGLWMHSGLRTISQLVSGELPPQLQLEVVSDAEVRVRFDENSLPILEQYCNAFLSAYAIAQEVFYAFGIAPHARVHVVAQLSATAREADMAQHHDDYFDIGFARQSFADAFLDTMLLVYRAAGRSPDRRIVHDMLTTEARTKLPHLDQLQQRWAS